MSFRDIWGRPLFHMEFPESGGAAPPAPGTGTIDPNDPSAPPPGAYPVADQDPPGPVPYARFREVNDQRRTLEEEIQPYRELVESGYGAEDLTRLTTWEQEYVQDPVGTWLRQAAEIDGLPDAVKAAIASVGESGASTQGVPSADGSPPPEAAPQVDDELRQRVEELYADRQAREAREQEEAVSAFYDGLVSAWKQLDEAQGIVTPDEAIHSFLAGASPNATSAEDILRQGRETFLAARESILSSATLPARGPGQTVPRPVPGGGGGSAPPVRPRTLAEARRAAEADPMFRTQ